MLCPAYFNDLVVGGVCCRVEVEGDQKKLYIMTLGVLAPYRRFGIGMESTTESTISVTSLYTKLM